MPQASDWAELLPVLRELPPAARVVLLMQRSRLAAPELPRTETPAKAVQVLVSAFGLGWLAPVQPPSLALAVQLPPRV